jgi:transcriptional regulator with XRE-family HTH domain
MDHERTVRVIRAGAGVYRVSQDEMARELGLSRSVISLYLNRRLNLLDQDAAKLLRLVGLEGVTEILSTLAGQGEV